MKYLNLSAALDQEESMIRATPAQIGVWFLLICYCTKQMNGGMIKGCQDWPDALWLRIAGVKAAVIARECPLWHFSGMVLVIHHYDLMAEEAYRKKQSLGRIYVERRWAKRRVEKIVKMPQNLSGNSENS